ncbi:MAG TPA: hypothetical protein VD970_13980 [Acetobacteraceae bacterium]|nr:hypothetical protein [Acetobacteraceae bacterium]
MSHDMHDDGLVHAHDWARDPSPLSRPAVPQGGSVPADGHDDGLVHGHGWARTDLPPPHLTR